MLHNMQYALYSKFKMSTFYNIGRAHYIIVHSNCSILIFKYFMFIHIVGLV